MPTIYLSSTYEDLKDYRQVVCEAFRKSGYTVIAMEDYVAADRRPVDQCLKDVEKADLYVGLFAFRYGYVPPANHGNSKNLSITELEFRHAITCQKPCLTFIAREDAGIPLKFVDAYTGDGKKGKRIEGLRQYLLTQKMTGQFSTPHALGNEVLAAVTKHLEDTKQPGVFHAQETDKPAAVTWNIEKDGSPYPGLFHFTRIYAPVFFGRDAEVRKILDRLREPEGRFMIISGASGSGKSSLVDAGVLPKIEKGALSSDCIYKCERMVPSQGSHPFDALVRPLHGYAERAGLSAFDLAESLLKEPQTLSGWIQAVVSKGLQGKGLVMFLDQMEELFTVRDQAQVRSFLSALYQAAHEVDVRVIATIRSDFLSYCYDHPEMLTVLNGDGHIALSQADATSIHEMIRQPARCAGLTISDSLVRRMAKEVGSESGSLPLLAFALQQLFVRRKRHELTEAAYENDLGGLTGAIGMHAGRVEKRITNLVKLNAQEVLPKIFAPLVTMLSEGQPTRNRVRKDTYNAELVPVVELFIKERLFQGEEGEGAGSLVSIAHEKLFQAWPTLAKWVLDNQQDLFTLRQADMQAGEWERQEYHPKYLWHVDRLKALQRIIARVGKESVKERVQQYAAPQDALSERLQKPTLGHQERLTIGQYLEVFGDTRPGVGLAEDGLPDIAWIKIPEGKIKLVGVDDHVFTVKPFLIAKYPVTNAQFQAFIFDRGYENIEWWRGIQKEPVPYSWQGSNAPREFVSWFEAVAFCRWLSVQTGSCIRLPTELEWQQAATGGDPAMVYPWGTEWDAARCNSAENRFRRTTPVGIYPNGATLQGVSDMAGNVWEWCLNTKDDPEKPESEGLKDWSSERVVRGGSWSSLPEFLRSANRFWDSPGLRNYGLGFRLAQGASTA